MSSVTVLERLRLFRNLCWTKGHYLFSRYKAMLSISNLDLEGGSMEHPGKISLVAGDSKRLLDMTAFKTPKQIWGLVRRGFIKVLISYVYCWAFCCWWCFVVVTVCMVDCTLLQ